MTISARPPWRAFNRRALARISITVTRGLSSRNSGTSRRPIARPIFAQSDSLSRPLRIFVESTWASLERIRWVSSLWPISSENTSTGRPVVWATCVAIPSPKAVLPIAGRAPTMFSVDGWRPDSSSSTSW